MDKKTPPPFDLDVFAESTRRALYELAVERFFRPTPPAEEGDRTWTPTWTPEEAGLQVLWLAGRWLVSWTRPGDRHLPERLRSHLLWAQPDPYAPDGVVFVDI